MKPETEELRQYIDAAVSWLKVRREILNNLNIFPVPDGDTGSNMLNTISSAASALENGSAEADLCAMIIEKSLWGARGNSGVILANFAKGFFNKLAQVRAESSSFGHIAAALEAGSDEAYKSTPDPVEGTILTLMKCAAGKARELVQQKCSSKQEFISALSAASLEGVKGTSDQLDILKTVGIVDAGACGFFYIIEAIERFINGEKVDESVKKEGFIPDEGSASSEWQVKPDAKYCIEITVRSSDRTDEIMESLSRFGTSEISITAGELTKVHLHTNVPDEAIKCAGEFSEVLDVYRENILTQQYRMLADRKEVLDGFPSVAAIVSGDGMKEIFRELGVHEVIDGGRTMNPSVQEIMNGIEAIEKENVILLINNDDACLSGTEASKQVEKNVGIIKTTCMMDGVSSMMDFVPENPFEKNLKAMEQRIGTVMNGFIAQAVLDTPTVKKGEFFSGGNRNIDTSGSLEMVFKETVAMYLSRDPLLNLLSLYTGLEAGDERIDTIRKICKEEFPAIELDCMYGGQPNYMFLYSIE